MVRKSSEYSASVISGILLMQLKCCRLGSSHSPINLLQLSILIYSRQVGPWTRILVMPLCSAGRYAPLPKTQCMQTIWMNIWLRIWALVMRRGYHYKQFVICPSSPCSRLLLRSTHSKRLHPTVRIRPWIKGSQTILWSLGLGFILDGRLKVWLDQISKWRQFTWDLVWQSHNIWKHLPRNMESTSSSAEHCRSSYLPNFNNCPGMWTGSI